MNNLDNAGYGRFIDFKDITHDSLFGVLYEMLTNVKYSRRAKEVSAIFNDNIVHPMIEHVIKFRGAKHLKSLAADMSRFIYLSLDVIEVNLVIGIGIIVACFWSIKYILSILFGCLLRRNAVDFNKKLQLMKFIYNNLN